MTSQAGIRQFSRKLKVPEIGPGPWSQGLAPLRSLQSCQHPDLGLLTWTSVREYISLVPSDPAMVICFPALGN